METISFIFLLFAAVVFFYSICRLSSNKWRSVDDILPPTSPVDVVRFKSSPIEISDYVLASDGDFVFIVRLVRRRRDIVDGRLVREWGLFWEEFRTRNTVDGLVRWSPLPSFLRDQVAQRVQRSGEELLLLWKKWKEIKHLKIFK